MPYWPYGWPKTLCCSSKPAGKKGKEAVEGEEPGLQDDGDGWVYVHQNHGYLLALSETNLQLWSAGQHKLRLCCHARSVESLQADGYNLAAFWSGSKGLVAVLVSGAAF